MAFRTLRITEIDPLDVAGVHWLPVRHTLGVQAFGVNAYRGDAGEQVIEEHTEEGSDHEEMYVVLHGRARFTLDGEDVDAPAGTAVFLPDPPTQRVAVAEEDGTVVLAVGGKPGAAYETSTWEWRFRAAPHARAGRLRGGRGDPARRPRRAPRRRRHPLRARLRRRPRRAARAGHRAARGGVRRLTADPGLGRGGRGPRVAARAAGLAAVTVAVIADVHGNAWALDAVLADARDRGADTFLDLGDTLDGPLDPVGTADRLLALGALTVRGNHDRMMVERDPSTAHALLRPEHHDWLAALPAIAEHEDLVLVHGAPHDDGTMLLETMDPAGTCERPLAEVEALLDGIDAPLILCGHSHTPRLVELPDGGACSTPAASGCRPTATPGRRRGRSARGARTRATCCCTARTGAGGRSSASSPTRGTGRRQAGRRARGLGRAAGHGVAVKARPRAPRGCPRSSGRARGSSSATTRASPASGSRASRRRGCRRAASSSSAPCCGAARSTAPGSRG